MVRRRTSYNEQTLNYGDISLNAEVLELDCKNSVRLSIKEFELLQQLILHAEHPLSTEYLLTHV